MSTRNERIKTLRKALKLTQDEFAYSLGYKTRGKITGIELAGAPVEPHLIDLICRLYPNVNKDWLAEGIGEMLLPKTREEEIAEYAASLIKESGSFKTRLIEALMHLDDEGWEKLKTIAEKALEK